MWHIHKPTKQDWHGDPSECPWPIAECLSWPKLEKPPADVLVEPYHYRVFEGDTIRPATAKERVAIDAAVAQIKQRCAEEILARWPDWRQRNMTARGLQLHAKAQTEPLSPAEQGELDAIAAAWAWIKDRRAQSDAEEAALP